MQQRHVARPAPPASNPSLQPNLSSQSDHGRGISKYRSTVPTPKVQEIAAVIATELAFLTTHYSGFSVIPFLAISVIGWVGYVLFRSKREGPPGLIRLGFPAFWNKHEMKEAFFRPTAFFVACFMGMFAFCVRYHQRFFINRNIGFLMLILSSWGLFQQLLLQGFFSTNLFKLMKEQGVSPKATVYAVTISSAVLFAAVHAPAGPIFVISSFVLGVIFSRMFLGLPNFIPLGLCYGLFGSFFTFLVLQYDPWAGEDSHGSIESSL